MNTDLLATLTNLIHSADRSPSQLRQDSVALFFNNFKKSGFFVEFGACDGFTYSNTWVLEKFFDWNGILSEPNPEWHVGLRGNRTAHLEYRAVSDSSGELVEFGVVDKKYALSKELSGIASFLSSEMVNVVTHTIKVETITLLELLENFSAPRLIDYMSIDTEGSELSIIRAFDFSRYMFNFLSIEHNGRPERKEMQTVLRRNGYIRLDCDHLSNFDDWFVHETHELADMVSG